MSDPRWLRYLPGGLRAQVAGRVNLHAVIHNSGWLLFDKLVRLLLGLVVGAWVARYLGPAQYGQLAYALAYLAFFQAIVGLGMDSILVRDIALNRGQASEILGTAFFLRLICGLVGWLLAVFGMGLLNGWGDGAVWLTALAGGALVFQAADAVDLWFQSQSKSRLTVVAKLAAYLLSSGVKVALILMQAPLPAFAGVFALDACVSAIGLFIAYRKFPSGRRWLLVKTRGVALLKESWPFLLSGLSIMVYIRIDQIMIKEMLGEAQLGIYAVILPLSTFWQVVPTTLAVSLAPIVAKQRQAGFVQYQRSIVLVFRIFFYLAVVFCLLTYVFSGWLVKLLYGPQYLEAVSILDLHVISNLFCFLGIAHGLWLVNERRFAVRLYGTLLAGGCAIFLNYWLLPLIGLLGACVAAIAAQAVAAFLANAVLDRASFWLQVEAITFRKVL